MKKFFKNFANFCSLIVRHFLEINGLVRASALAYTTLLALVPLTMVAVGILSIFPAFSSYIHKINQALFKHFVPASADIIQHYLEDFASQTSRLSWLGIIFSILSAVLLISTIEEALNAIWQVKASAHRKGLSAFLIYWSIITLLPLAVGSAIALTVYLNALPYVSSVISTLSQYLPLLHLLPVAVTWLTFLFLYMTLPNYPVKFGHAALGALVAALFFEGMKAFFSFYIRNFSSDFFIFGAIAVIPIFLLWIYLCWIMVIFGGVITHLLATGPPRRHKKSPR